jgi:hypothetical protein
MPWRLPVPRDEIRPLLVRMPAELHAAVKATAEKEDRTMAQVAREALRAYTRKSARTATN